MRKKAIAAKELVLKCMNDSFNQRSGNKEYRRNVATNLVSKIYDINAQERLKLHSFASDYAENFRKAKK